MIPFKRSLLLLAMSGALAACGGSDDTSSDPVGGGDGGSTSSSVVTEGVITGFGSVYVNGQRYESDGATISVGDTAAGEESQLRVGMVVKVAASTSDDGSDPEAEQITYEESLQGPISFIDRSANQLTVLGQTVIFDELTEFEDSELALLAIGDIVEVSGYINENGKFLATLIDLENDENEVKVRGAVTNLDTNAQTFKLNQLTIDYSAAEFDDMVADDLADGLLIKVEGTEISDDGKTLTAASIENKSNIDFDDVDEITIAGMVRDFNADEGTFVVNQYSFSLNSETEFDDGTLDTLANGIIVKVEARLEGDNLIAEEVEFKAKDARSKTEGQVSAVDADNNTFVVNDITFTVTAETQYEDESDLDERRFTFDDIAANDWLKVVSRQDDNGNAVALKVERINENDRDGELKGKAEDVSLEGMTVANVQVRFTDNTEFEADDSMSPAEFVELAANNNALIVEVEGDEYDGDVLVATEVEVESDDNADDNTGRVEFTGQIDSVNGESAMVQGTEIRFVEASELELNDEEVDLATFVAALAEGLVIDVEGVWKNQEFVEVREAEMDTPAE